MKIVIATFTFPTISEPFVQYQALQLKKLGHQVNILGVYGAKNTAETSYNTLLDDTLAEITIVEKPFIITKIFRFLNYVSLALKHLVYQPKLLFKLLLNNNIKAKYTYLSALNLSNLFSDAEVVHAHFGPIGHRIINYQLLGIINRDTKIITSFHGDDIDGPKFYRNIAYYKNLIKANSAIIANSNYLKQKLIDTGFASKSITLVKVGVNTERFSPLQNKPYSPAFNILTVARLTAVKGIEYSIKAIQLLVNQGHKNINYQIIGGGELFDTLQALIAELKLEQYVKLLGAKTQEEIISHYRQANLLILSSIVTDNGCGEAQGLAVQEAQAMELPVIATNVGGIAEGLINSVTGYIVQQKSPVQIADKIEYLFQNPQIATQMGKEGRAFILQNFDNNKLINQITTLYKVTT